MIRAVLVLAMMASLSACGADGDPIPPAPKETPKPGVSISGTASIGITG